MPKRTSLIHFCVILEFFPVRSHRVSCGVVIVKHGNNKCRPVDIVELAVNVKHLDEDQEWEGKYGSYEKHFVTDTHELLCKIPDAYD